MYVPTKEKIRLRMFPKAKSFNRFSTVVGSKYTILNDDPKTNNIINKPSQEIGDGTNIGVEARNREKIKFMLIIMNTTPKPKAIFVDNE